jgi:hypothetical protein
VVVLVGNAAGFTVSNSKWSSFELELSKTGFQGLFRRKAPIGNEVAKPRRMLSYKSITVVERVFITSEKGMFRRKAPIGNEVARPRRRLPTNQSITVVERVFYNG